MSATQGQFGWVELMTEDVGAAAKFYGALLGFEARDAGGAMDYQILHKNGVGFGGMMKMPAVAKAGGMLPCWLGYVMVDDIETSLVAAKAAGGRSYTDIVTVPDMLRFIAVSDPHGAPFYLMQPMGSPPSEGMPKPGEQGTVGWRELLAGDLASDFAFYSGLFGWKKTEVHDMGPMGPYQLWAAGEQTGGMMTKPKESPRPLWNYYFNVDTLDAAVARAKDAGGKIVNGPMQVPGGQWVAQGFDPQGAFFCLVANVR